MKPNKHFLNKSNAFWAIVRYCSQQLGYSDRKTKGMKRYDIEQLNYSISQFNIPINLLKEVLHYLNYRAELIDIKIELLLMDREQAKDIFENLKSKYDPKCPLPLNKQKGPKKHFNYFSCIINILTEINLIGKSFVGEPRALTLITDQNKKPVMTLSRWMDGAYPNVHNPVAVWEIKEYYGTTTFGSRVADGVYETQLDGYEILEAGKFLKRKIEHYLLIDDRFTWWTQGKSYLCRIIDMMHMGLVDEVILGKEVLYRWPEIVKAWP